MPHPANRETNTWLQLKMVENKCLRTGSSTRRPRDRKSAMPRRAQHAAEGWGATGDKARSQPGGRWASTPARRCQPSSKTRSNADAYNAPHALNRASSPSQPLRDGHQRMEEEEQLLRQNAWQPPLPWYGEPHEVRAKNVLRILTGRRTSVPAVPLVSSPNTYELVSSSAGEVHCMRPFHGELPRVCPAQPSCESTTEVKARRPSRKLPLLRLNARGTAWAAAGTGISIGNRA